MRSSVISGSEPGRRARPAVQPAIPAAAAGPATNIATRATIAKAPKIRGPYPSLRPTHLMPLLLPRPVKLMRVEFWLL